MAIEPDDLAARLLDAEPVSPARRQRLEQEINAMFENKLSHGGRVYWSVSLAAAVALAALGAAVLAWGRMDGPLRAVWWVYTLANVGFVVLAAGVLRAGRLDVRRFASWGKLSPALTLLIVILLLARAVAEPTTEAVLWVLFGITCLIVALTVVLYSRMTAAELVQREQLLRVELRVVELTERLGAAAKPAGGEAAGRP